MGQVVSTRPVPSYAEYLDAEDSSIRAPCNRSPEASQTSWLARLVAPAYALGVAGDLQLCIASFRG